MFLSCKVIVWGSCTGSDAATQQPPVSSRSVVAVSVLVRRAFHRITQKIASFMTPVVWMEHGPKKKPTCPLLLLTMWVTALHCQTSCCCWTSQQAADCNTFHTSAQRREIRQFKTCCTRGWLGVCFILGRGHGSSSADMEAPVNMFTKSHSHLIRNRQNLFCDADHELQIKASPLSRSYLIFRCCLKSPSGFSCALKPCPCCVLHLAGCRAHLWFSAK